MPEFLHESVGGHFKGRNPTVNITDLQANWVKDTKVIYIGQAGGGNSNATLKKRLRQYMRFGQGQPVGHWRGRFIWQISNNRDLIICWKPIPDEDPGIIEKFYDHYGKKPYANLTG